MDAGWELDFWGRVRRSVESAEANYQASIENYRDVMVLLYAEIALNYAQVRKLQAQILYTESNIKAQRSTLQITRDRYKADIAPLLDVHQAERNLAARTAQIGVATAELYPRFSLIGDIGFSATSNLINVDNLFWTIGPVFRWSIFNAGRIRSQIKWCIREWRWLLREQSKQYDRATGS